MQTILHGFSALAQTFGGSAAELHHDDLYLTCERWFLCSKIIRQLIISGFPSDAKTLQVWVKIHSSAPLPKEKKHKKDKGGFLVNSLWSE